MRVAAIVVVLIIHGVFLLLFAAHRNRLPGEEQAPSITFFVPLAEVVTQPEGALKSATTARAAHPARSKRTARAAKSPDGTAGAAPQPPANSITEPALPDWRHEMQIAANNEIEAEARRRQSPSLLAPHDFSGVKGGSTDDTKPRFAWDHAATHRVEEIPTGGLLININDRCAIAWVIFPFPFCRIGKIQSHGDLFGRMKDAPALGDSGVP